MRVTRATAVLSLATAAVIGLSACSSDGGDKPERGSETSESAAGSEEAPSSDDFDLTAEDVIARITAASQEAGTVSMEMETSAAEQSMSASGVLRYGDATQEIAMTIDSPDAGGTVELRVVGGMIYMSMAELTEGKFVQIDPADTSNPLAAAFAPMMSQMDPTAQLSTYEGAILSFEKSGEPEEVGGALAQPYEMTIDSAKVLAAMGGTADAAGVPAELVSTYWVDADDLIRRVQSESAGSTVDMTMSGWGDPVEIVAPTADQLTELPGF
jgi:hypothetical protein